MTEISLPTRVWQPWKPAVLRLTSSGPELGSFPFCILCGSLTAMGMTLISPPPTDRRRDETSSGRGNGGAHPHGQELPVQDPQRSHR